MPRVSKVQTAANREAIEDAAARLVRERGLAVSVADVMEAAGLTHGGFYGHFASKDALAAAACARAFGQSLERWERRAAERDDGVAGLAAVVDGYLSTRSRDTPGTGCPAAALAGDVAREPSGAAVRDAYADGVAALAERLAGLDRADGGTGDEDDALARLATMVGALALARATAGTRLSPRILAAARHALTGVAGPRTRRKSS